jgi:hypothetical protein
MSERHHGHRRFPHLTGSGALACDRGIRNGVADTWRAGVSGKSRSARVLGRVMRQTSVFDRKGTRMILRVLARLNELEGNPGEAAVQTCRCSA